MAIFQSRIMDTSESTIVMSSVLEHYIPARQLQNGQRIMYAGRSPSCSMNVSSGFG